MKQKGLPVKRKFYVASVLGSLGESANGITGGGPGERGDDSSIQGSTQMPLIKERLKQTMGNYFDYSFLPRLLSIVHREKEWTE